jgi:hypothetical protein
MSDISPTSGAYVSDAELLSWMHQKSVEQNSELRGLMGQSTQRGQLIQRLVEIKAQVDGNGHPDNVSEMITDLIDDPDFAHYQPELQKLLGECVTALNDAHEKGYTALSHDDLKNLKGKLSSVLQGEVDRLGQDDQLALIQIQTLVSDVRETSQLTSNVLDARSQTQNSIIGNIRA